MQFLEGDHATAHDCAATECATTEGLAARTVKVTVDDATGKSGGLFSQAPPGLVVGTVRIEVTTD